jgi:hypothetical protein
MSNLRVRVRRGEVEIEVQGSSSEVEKWFKDLSSRFHLDSTPTVSAPHKGGGAEREPEASIDDVASRIQKDARWELIYDRILRQRPALPCELVVLLFAPEDGLGAAEISEVLRTLGRGSSQPQVTRDLAYRGGKKYVLKERRSGRYRFKINAAGREYLKSILDRAA